MLRTLPAVLLVLGAALAAAACGDSAGGQRAPDSDVAAPPGTIAATGDEALDAGILPGAGTGDTGDAGKADTGAEPSGGKPDAGAADAGIEPAGGQGEPHTRPFFLASTGVQISISGKVGMHILPANLADDVDLVSVHNDFYGLPWDEFEAGTEPPAEWVAEMDRIAAIVQDGGKGVFLSLQLVAGPTRHHLASKAVVENGELKQVEAWSAECYDFAAAPDGAAKQAAYVAYVDWMVKKFAPRFVNVAIEMNMFMNCGAAWDGLVEVERAAYAAAKAAQPEVIAFPSIQIDMLQGLNAEFCTAGLTPEECFEENYARLEGVVRDRFAISTYPHGSDKLKTVKNIPPDWFTRAAARGGERVVIAEAGWNAVDAVGFYNGQCLTAIPSMPEEQLAYLQRLVSDARKGGWDLITWWSNRDLIPSFVMTDCPCDDDPTWCEVASIFRSTGGGDPLKQFYGEMLMKLWGTMGIREHDGTPREPIYSYWKSIQAMPVAP